MTMQLGLFSTDDNKTVKPKRARKAKVQSTQLSMFTIEEMTGQGKLTELHEGYTPKMILTSEDTRTEEEKETDRRHEAEAKTISMFEREETTSFQIAVSQKINRIKAAIENK